VVGWTKTLLVCAGMTLVAFIVVAVSVASTADGGLIRFCPDGGDDIWTRPSLAAYLVWSDYLSHWGEPARFRCGDSFSGRNMPGWATPTLLAAFAVAFAAAVAVSVIRRPAATS
jgi:hypothetical protein